MISKTCLVFMLYVVFHVNDDVMKIYFLIPIRRLMLVRASYNILTFPLISFYFAFFSMSYNVLFCEYVIIMTKNKRRKIKSYNIEQTFIRTLGITNLLCLSRKAVITKLYVTTTLLPYGLVCETVLIITESSKGMADVFC